MLTAGAANAAFIGFTDEASYSDGTFVSASGSIDGVGISPIPTPANGALARTTGDAPGKRSSPNDGNGTDTGEVSFRGGKPQPTLSFAREVTVDGPIFLDTSTQPDAGDDDDSHGEAVTAPYGMDPQTFRSPEKFRPGCFGSRSFTGLSLIGTSFICRVTMGTDLQVDPDIVLAGANVVTSDVNPVPLPTAIKAMAGFGAMRRRKDKTAA